MATFTNFTWKLFQRWCRSAFSSSTLSRMELHWHGASGALSQRRVRNGCRAISMIPACCMPKCTLSFIFPSAKHIVKVVNVSFKAAGRYMGVMHDGSGAWWEWCMNVPSAVLLFTSWLQMPASPFVTLSEKSIGLRKSCPHWILRGRACQGNVFHLRKALT